MTDSSMSLPVDMSAELRRSQSQQSLDSMDQLRQRGFKNDPQALREAAEQFESIFLGMVLKSMREANAVFEQDNPLNSRYSKMYRDMYDGELSKSLSGNLGLADLLVEQFSGLQNIHRVPDQGRAGAELELPHRPELSAETRQPSAPVRVIEKYYGAQRHQAFASPEQFVEQLQPLAQQAAEKLGVAPSVLLAQAALETGWGSRLVPGSRQGSSYNLFNIKADERWSGEKAHVQTLEYRDGIAKRERAAFRVYPGYEQSFDDFVRFLQDNPRYQPAVSAGQDDAAFVTGLQQAGYATDPQYADKISRLQQRIEQLLGQRQLAAANGQSAAALPLTASAE